jgi:hypothetical protein
MSLLLISTLSGCHEHLLPHVLVALDYMLILLVDWLFFCQQFLVAHGPHAQCLHALHVNPIKHFIVLQLLSR